MVTIGVFHDSVALPQNASHGSSCPWPRAASSSYFASTPSGLGQRKANVMRCRRRMLSRSGRPAVQARRYPTRRAGPTVWSPWRGVRPRCPLGCPDRAFSRTPGRHACRARRYPRGPVGSPFPSSSVFLTIRQGRGATNGQFLARPRRGRA